MKFNNIFKFNKYTFIFLIVWFICGVGMTYAYYAYVVEEESVLVGSAVDINVDLDVELVVGNNNGLVPLNGTNLSKALNGIGSTNGACIDSIGNLSCQVYKITLVNYGSRVRHVNGTIELYAKEGTGNAYSNLKWIELEDPTTIKEGVFQNGMSKSTLVSNLTIESKAVGIWYIAVWLEETDGDQLNTDKGDFGGIVKFESDLLIGDGLVENVLERNAENDQYLDFSKTSIDGDTNGVYVRNEVTNDGEYPIYYWRGSVENNLIFAEHCWKMIRTTKTGGLKILYNGRHVNGVCNNTGDDTILARSKFNTNSNIKSLAYGGYMYNDDYIYTDKTMTGATYSFANDVVYQNGVYNFVDDPNNPNDVITSSSWSTIQGDGLAGTHYFCLDGSTSCASVGYIFSTTTTKAYYYTLSNGAKIEDALASMLGTDDENIDSYNSKSSSIKGNKDTPNTIDWWYYHNIETAGYKTYLEDTVWCDDRRWDSLGGFDPDNGSTAGYMTFQSLNRTWHTFQPSLECARKVDSFTADDTVNGNGKLDYPIGLLTPDEVVLSGGAGGVANNDFYLYSAGDYWVFGANNFYNRKIVHVYVNYEGRLNGTFIDSGQVGIRPAVSLARGYVIESGKGTTDEPFVLDAPPILNDDN